MDSTIVRDNMMFMNPVRVLCNSLVTAFIQILLLQFSGLLFMNGNVFRNGVKLKYIGIKTILVRIC